MTTWRNHASAEFNLSNHTGYKNVTHDNMDKSRIVEFAPSNYSGYKNVIHDKDVD
jgi:hypothetical protein